MFFLLFLAQGGDSSRKPTGGLGLEKNYYP